MRFELKSSLVSTLWNKLFPQMYNQNVTTVEENSRKIDPSFLFLFGFFIKYATYSSRFPFHKSSCSASLLFPVHFQFSFPSFVGFSLANMKFSLSIIHQLSQYAQLFFCLLILYFIFYYISSLKCYFYISVLVLTPLFPTSFIWLFFSLPHLWSLMFFFIEREVYWNFVKSLVSHFYRFRSLNFPQ